MLCFYSAKKLNELENIDIDWIVFPLYLRLGYGLAHQAIYALAHGQKRHQIDSMADQRGRDIGKVLGHLDGSSQEHSGFLNRRFRQADGLPRTLGHACANCFRRRAVAVELQFT